MTVLCEASDTPRLIPPYEIPPMTDAVTLGSEVVLATLPAADAAGRMLVVLVQTGDGSSCVQLRQQSWAGDVLGWFTQSSVTLEPQQVAALRNSLGSTAGGHDRPATKLPKKFSRLEPSNWQPRIVCAEGA
ncbi:hypothetical protein Psta_1622 [Pirellula staleyi DSM 6068]|uniref:Uncharacterized protein n=1 Tax=Pirellula staleyi (strain ATCC 27377 / DSM 6068 / ICPB 4128) TaxID=530564 RepID=D2QY83_PIRSD|nr:hypothetical protein Psta_1622 [Pirellula staleyi DSM 6068]